MALPSVGKTRVPGSAVIVSLKLAFKDAGVIRPAISRSVAQSGSAPRSGRGVRRLTPCPSAQYLAGPERASPTVSPTVILVPPRQVLSPPTIRIASSEIREAFERWLAAERRRGTP